MPIKPVDFQLSLALSPQQMIAAIGGLYVAFQSAVIVKANEILAAHPANREERLRLFDAYTKQVLNEAKNTATWGMIETDEAAGMKAALDIINAVVAGIRRQLEGAP